MIHVGGIWLFWLLKRWIKRKNSYVQNLEYLLSLSSVHRQRGSTHGYLGSQAEARSEPHKLARKSHTSHSTIVMLCCSCIVVVANDWVSNCGRVMHNMYIEIRTSLTASADMINSKNSVLHHSNFQPDANQSRCSVNWTLSIKLLLHVAYYN